MDAPIRAQLSSAAAVEAGLSARLDEFEAEREQWAQLEAEREQWTQFEAEREQWSQTRALFQQERQESHTELSTLREELAREREGALAGAERLRLLETERAALFERCAEQERLLRERPSESTAAPPPDAAADAAVTKAPAAEAAAAAPAPKRAAAEEGRSVATEDEEDMTWDDGEEAPASPQQQVQPHVAPQRVPPAPRSEASEPSAEVVAALQQRLAESRLLTQGGGSACTRTDRERVRETETERSPMLIASIGCCVEMEEEYSTSLAAVEEKLAKQT